MMISAANESVVKANAMWWNLSIQWADEDQQTLWKTFNWARHNHIQT